MDIYPVIMLLRRGQLVLSRLIFDRFYRRLLPLVPFSLRLLPSLLHGQTPSASQK